MHIRLMLASVGAGAIVAFAAVAPASAASLVTNGSFENGTGSAAFGSFATEPVSATNITGWTVTGKGTDAIDWINGYWQAAQGTHSLDLSGLQNGGIFQDIATVAGKTYLVTFDMAGNPDGPPNIETLVASASPVSNGTIPGVDLFVKSLVSPSGATHSNMGWISESYTFVATSALTQLEFSSGNSGANNTPYGPALDNVAAFAGVPELGTWALMLAGFGMIGAAVRLQRRQGSALPVI